MHACLTAAALLVILNSDLLTHTTPHIQTLLCTTPHTLPMPHPHTTHHTYHMHTCIHAQHTGSPAAAQLQILVGLIRSNVSYYSLIQGDQLILLCSYAQGSNIYGVAWTKDLVPLTSHLTVGSSGVTFSLGSVNRSDAGLYVCAAQNQQGGVVQAGVMVNVQCKCDCVWCDVYV